MTQDVPERFAVDFRGRTLLGVYRVGERLATGGMGSVYRGENLTLGQPVVVKVPDVALLTRPGFRKRFEREIQQLVRFDHPHIVRIQAAGEQEGVPFFVLQYLAGGSLVDRLERVGGQQAPDEVLEWLRPIAGALDWLHARGAVHRDVKPGNILFHGEGTAYLSDFGIAQVLGGESLTTTGGRLYTPAYAPPEQIRDDAGTAPLDGRSDQYALAATVFEALGGRPPFTGSTSEILVSKLRDQVPDLAPLAPHVPLSACRALSKAMAREPRDRHTTCLAFVERFSAGLAATSEPGAATRQGPGPGEDPGLGGMEPPGSRGRWAAVLVPVLLAGVVAAGLWSLTRPSRKAPSDSRAGPGAAEQPSAAWEADLAAAESARRALDGRAASLALTKARAAGAQGPRVDALAAYVQEWEAPPLLTLESPEAAAHVQGLRVEVVGRAERLRASDRLFVDDEPVAVDHGRFRAWAQRNGPGPASIRVTLKDAGALRLERVLVVTFEVPAPQAAPPAPPTPPASASPPPAPSVSPSLPAVLQVVPSLEEALAEARRTDRLVLAIFTHAPCGRCVKLTEALVQHADLASRADRAVVAVRTVKRGAEDEDDIASEAELYGISSYTNALVLAEDGAPLGAVVPVTSEAGSVTNVMEALDAAVRAAVTYREERDRLRAGTSLNGLSALRDYYLRQGHLRGYAATCARIAELAPSPASHRTLRGALKRTGDRAALRALLDRLIAAEPRSPEQAAWRTERALLEHWTYRWTAESTTADWEQPPWGWVGMEGLLRGREDARMDLTPELGPVLAWAEGAGDREGNFGVRWILLKFLLLGSDPDGARWLRAKAHLDWMEAHRPTARLDAMLRLLKVESLAVLTERGYAPETARTDLEWVATQLGRDPLAARALKTQALWHAQAKDLDATRRILDQLVRDFPGTHEGREAAAWIKRLEEERASESQAPAAMGK